jgi:hypothetical protein
MAGNVDQLTQKIADLDQKAEDLEASLRATYGSYLNALAKTLRQQLILASYYICTEGYPEDFLKLPLSQRYDLQGKLKAIAQDTRVTLENLLLEPQPAAPASPVPFLLGGGNFLPGKGFSAAFGMPNGSIAIDISDLAIDSDDDEPETDPDTLELESLNDLESTLEQIQEQMQRGAFAGDSDLLHQEEEEEVEDDEDEDDEDEDDEDEDDEDEDDEDEDDEPIERSNVTDRRKNKNNRRGMTEADARELQAILAQVAAAISAKEPKTPIDRLTTWQESMERGIQDKIRLASYQTNQALQQATLIPAQVPDRALEAASRVDSDANSPVPHVVQMLVETGNSDDKAAQGRAAQERNASGPQVPKLLHVIALQMRLGELEFNDPILMRWRSRLRELSGKTHDLIREYRKYQRKRSVAEAQDAWRSSWTNEE